MAGIVVVLVMAALCFAPLVRFVRAAARLLEPEQSAQ